MATSYQLITLVAKASTYRFYPVNAPVNTNQNFVQFDQASYDRTRMEWQTPKVYTQKNTFADPVTLLVHTQANYVGDATPYPGLNVYKLDGTLVGVLNVFPFTKGAQQAENVEVDGVQLNSYAFTFTWGQIFTTYGLDPLIDNGLFYLEIVNTAIDGTTELIHRSEPVMVFDSFPNTVLITAYNNINKAAQYTLCNGWDDEAYNPLFALRVEGYPEQYEQNGILIGYLQQAYLQQQLRGQNFRTFKLNLGGISTGVPDYVVEKTSELMVMDYFEVDYKGFIINNAGGNDGSVKPIWKKTGGVTGSQLNWWECPIRERNNYANATIVTLPIPDVTIFTSPWEGTGGFIYYWLLPFTMQQGGSAITFPSFISYDEAGEDINLVALNDYGTAMGMTGNFYRDADYVIKYQQGTGESWSLLTPTELYTDYFTVTNDITAPSSTAEFSYVGASGSANTVKMGIDWGDTAGVVDVVITADFAVSHNVPHTYLLTGTKVAFVFHNNKCGLIYFTDTTGCKFKELGGNMQSALTSVSIKNCTNVTTPLPMLPVAVCTNLQLLTVINTNVDAFDDLLTTAFPTLSVVDLSANKLTSTAIDQAFNDFYSATATTVTAGVFKTNAQSPLAFPTGASLTARNFLTATRSWTVTT